MYFKCRHPGCERAFDTKLGRAVHERILHGANYSEHRANYCCPHCGADFETEIRLETHMRDLHGIPSKTLDWVEKRNFENLVYLYNDELNKINSENVIAGVLDEREKTKLLQEGVLVIEEYGRMGKRTVYSLTEEALEALKKLDSEINE
jgi:hypothetical protein